MCEEEYVDKSTVLGARMCRRHILFYVVFFMTRSEVIEKLLKSYAPYYNIHPNDSGDDCFVARCDFFEKTKKYFLSQKAELWNSDSEEFIYLFNIPHLSLEAYEKYLAFARDDGMGRMDIHPGHMYTFITPVFICDTYEEAALKALKKCRIYQSFHFSLHGWMDVHVAAVSLNNNKIVTNYSGHTTGKILKKVLFHKSKKRRV